VTTEHRKAPRRTVVSVNKVGKWGSLTYEHTLNCGHIEVRKRKSSTDKLACAGCYRASQFQREMGFLNRTSPPAIDDDGDNTIEFRINEIRASIAARFNVPLEAVDIASSISAGGLVVQYATVFLSGSDVARISE
jgi:hypothetical protein